MAEKHERKKKIFAEFFKTEIGNEPVRNELKLLGRPASIEIGSDIRFVEENWRVDRPYVDRIRSGSGKYEKAIYEVRHLVDGREYRTLFFVYENRMVLVHFIAKKTRKTPQAAIKLTSKRMKLWIAMQIDIESRMKEKGK